MQQRQKWTHKKRIFKCGDTVLIADNTAPRNAWQIGKGIEVFPDSKGLVCHVCIKTKTSILERPINKLCLLQEMENKFFKGLKYGTK